MLILDYEFYEFIWNIFTRIYNVNLWLWVFRIYLKHFHQNIDDCVGPPQPAQASILFFWKWCKHFHHSINNSVGQSDSTRSSIFILKFHWTLSYVYRWSCLSAIWGLIWIIIFNILTRAYNTKSYFTCFTNLIETILLDYTNKSWITIFTNLLETIFNRLYWTHAIIYIIYWNLQIYLKTLFYQKLQNYVFYKFFLKT